MLLDSQQHLSTYPPCAGGKGRESYAFIRNRESCTRGISADENRSFGRVNNYNFRTEKSLRNFGVKSLFPCCQAAWLLPSAWLLAFPGTTDSDAAGGELRVRGTGFDPAQ